MANVITTKAKFVKLLLRPAGATGEELRVAMNRVWKPTIYQLGPIAKRLDMVLWHQDGGSDEPMRYFFTPKAPAKAA